MGASCSAGARDGVAGTTANGGAPLRIKNNSSSGVATGVGRNGGHSSIDDIVASESSFVGGGGEVGPILPSRSSSVFAVKKHANHPNTNKNDQQHDLAEDTHSSSLLANFAFPPPPPPPLPSTPLGAILSKLALMNTPSVQAEERNPMWRTSDGVPFTLSRCSENDYALLREILRPAASSPAQSPSSSSSAAARLEASINSFYALLAKLAKERTALTSSSSSSSSPAAMVNTIYNAPLLPSSSASSPKSTTKTKSAPFSPSSPSHPHHSVSAASVATERIGVEMENGLLDYFKKFNTSSATSADDDDDSDAEYENDDDTDDDDDESDSGDDNGDDESGGENNSEKNKTTTDRRLRASPLSILMTSNSFLSGVAPSSSSADDDDIADREDTAGTKGDGGGGNDNSAGKPLSAMEALLGARKGTRKKKKTNKNNNNKDNASFASMPPPLHPRCALLQAAVTVLNTFIDSKEIQTLLSSPPTATTQQPQGGGGGAGGGKDTRGGKAKGGDGGVGGEASGPSPFSFALFDPKSPLFSPWEVAEGVMAMMLGMGDGGSSSGGRLHPGSALLVASRSALVKFILSEDAKKKNKKDPAAADGTMSADGDALISVLFPSSTSPSVPKTNFVSLADREFLFGGGTATTTAAAANANISRSKGTNNKGRDPASPAASGAGAATSSPPLASQTIQFKMQCLAAAISVLLTEFYHFCLIYGVLPSLSAIVNTKSASTATTAATKGASRLPAPLLKKLLKPLSTFIRTEEKKMAKMIGGNSGDAGDISVNLFSMETIAKKNKKSNKKKADSDGDEDDETNDGEKAIPAAASAAASSPSHLLENLLKHQRTIKNASAAHEALRLLLSDPSDNANVGVTRAASLFFSPWFLGDFLASSSPSSSDRSDPTSSTAPPPPSSSPSPLSSPSQHHHRFVKCISTVLKTLYAYSGGLANIVSSDVGGGSAEGGGVGVGVSANTNSSGSSSNAFLKRADEVTLHEILNLPALESPLWLVPKLVGIDQFAGMQTEAKVSNAVGIVGTLAYVSGVLTLPGLGLIGGGGGGGGAEVAVYDCVFGAPFTDKFQKAFKDFENKVSLFKSSLSSSSSTKASQVGSKKKSGGGGGGGTSSSSSRSKQWEAIVEEGRALLRSVVGVGGEATDFFPPTVANSIYFSMNSSGDLTYNNTTMNNNAAAPKRNTLLATGNVMNGQQQQISRPLIKHPIQQWLPYFPSFSLSLQAKAIVLFSEAVLTGQTKLSLQPVHRRDVLTSTALLLSAPAIANGGVEWESASPKRASGNNNNNEIQKQQQQQFQPQFNPYSAVVTGADLFATTTAATSSLLAAGGGAAAGPLSPSNINQQQHRSDSTATTNTTNSTNTNTQSNSTTATAANNNTNANMLTSDMRNNPVRGGSIADSMLAFGGVVGGGGGGNVMFHHHHTKIQQQSPAAAAVIGNREGSITMTTSIDLGGDDEDEDAMLIRELGGGVTGGGGGGGVRRITGVGGAAAVVAGAGAPHSPHQHHHNNQHQSDGSSRSSSVAGAGFSTTTVINADVNNTNNTAAAPFLPLASTSSMPLALANYQHPNSINAGGVGGVGGGKQRFLGALRSAAAREALAEAVRSICDVVVIAAVGGGGGGVGGNEGKTTTTTTASSPPNHAAIIGIKRRDLSSANSNTDALVSGGGGGGNVVPFLDLQHVSGMINSNSSNTQQQQQHRQSNANDKGHGGGGNSHHHHHRLALPSLHPPLIAPPATFKVFPLFIKDGAGVERGEGHGPRKEFFDGVATMATSKTQRTIDLANFMATFGGKAFILGGGATTKTGSTMGGVGAHSNSIRMMANSVFGASSTAGGGGGKGGGEAPSSTSAPSPSTAAAAAAVDYGKQLTYYLLATIVVPAMLAEEDREKESTEQPVAAFLPLLLGGGGGDSAAAAPPPAAVAAATASSSSSSSPSHVERLQTRVNRLYNSITSPSNNNSNGGSVMCFFWNTRTAARVVPSTTGSGGGGAAASSPTTTTVVVGRDNSICFEKGDTITYSYSPEEEDDDANGRRRGGGGGGGDDGGEARTREPSSSTISPARPPYSRRGRSDGHSPLQQNTVTVSQTLFYSPQLTIVQLSSKVPKAHQNPPNRYNQHLLQYVQQYVTYYSSNSGNTFASSSAAYGNNPSASASSAAPSTLLAAPLPPPQLLPGIADAALPSVGDCALTPATTPPFVHESGKQFAWLNTNSCEGFAEQRAVAGTLAKMLLLSSAAASANNTTNINSNNKGDGSSNHRDNSPATNNAANTRDREKRLNRLIAGSPERENVFNNNNNANANADENTSNNTGCSQQLQQQLTQLFSTRRSGGKGSGGDEGMIPQRVMAALRQLRDGKKALSDVAYRGAYWTLGWALGNCVANGCCVSAALPPFLFELLLSSSSSSSSTIASLMNRARQASFPSASSPPFSFSPSPSSPSSSYISLHQAAALLDPSILDHAKEACGWDFDTLKMILEGEGLLDDNNGDDDDDDASDDDAFAGKKKAQAKPPAAANINNNGELTTQRQRDRLAHLLLLQKYIAHQIVGDRVWGPASDVLPASVIRVNGTDNAAAAGEEVKGGGGGFGAPHPPPRAQPPAASVSPRATLRAAAAAPTTNVPIAPSNAAYSDFDLVYFDGIRPAEDYNAILSAPKQQPQQQQQQRYQQRCGILLLQSLKEGFDSASIASSPILAQCPARLAQTLFCGASTSDDGVSDTFKFNEQFTLIADRELKRMGVGKAFFSMLIDILNNGFNSGNDAGQISSSVVEAEKVVRSNEEVDYGYENDNVVVPQQQQQQQKTSAKRELLKFITGRTLLPPRPLQEHIKFEMPLAPMNAKEFDKILFRLPSSHSCGNVIEVPNYLEALLLGTNSPYYVLSGRKKGSLILDSHKEEAWQMLVKSSSAAAVGLNTRDKNPTMSSLFAELLSKKSEESDDDDDDDDDANNKLNSSSHQNGLELLLAKAKRITTAKLKMAVLQSDGYELDDAAVPQSLLMKLEEEGGLGGFGGGFADGDGSELGGIPAAASLDHFNASVSSSVATTNTLMGGPPNSSSIRNRISSTTVIQQQQRGGGGAHVNAPSPLSGSVPRPPPLNTTNFNAAAAAASTMMNNPNASVTSVHNAAYASPPSSSPSRYQQQYYNYNAAAAAAGSSPSSTPRVSNSGHGGGGAVGAVGGAPPTIEDVIVSGGVRFVFTADRGGLRNLGRVSTCLRSPYGLAPCLPLPAASLEFPFTSASSEATSQAAGRGASAVVAADLTSPSPMPPPPPAAAGGPSVTPAAYYSQGSTTSASPQAPAEQLDGARSQQLVFSPSPAHNHNGGGDKSNNAGRQKGVGGAESFFPPSSVLDSSSSSSPARSLPHYLPPNSPSLARPAAVDNNGGGGDGSPYPPLPPEQQQQQHQHEGGGGGVMTAAPIAGRRFDSASTSTSTSTTSSSIPFVESIRIDTANGDTSLMMSSSTDPSMRHNRHGGGGGGVRTVITSSAGGARPPLPPSGGGTSSDVASAHHAIVSITGQNYSQFTDGGAASISIHNIHGRPPQPPHHFVTNASATSNAANSQKGAMRRGFSVLDERLNPSHYPTAYGDEEHNNDVLPVLRPIDGSLALLHGRDSDDDDDALSSVQNMSSANTNASPSAAKGGGVGRFGAMREVPSLSNLTPGRRGGGGGGGGPTAATTSAAIVPSPVSKATTAKNTNAATSNTMRRGKDLDALENELFGGL